ncbi:MAG: hypothetical protein JSS60_04030 [Verrucomicrobia bacterium]|nr:hypothetical protein [Verrucomicrobiota bacterium]
MKNIQAYAANTVSSMEYNYPNNIPNALSKLNNDVFNAFFNYAPSSLAGNVSSAIGELNNAGRELSNGMDSNKLVGIAGRLRNAAEQLEPVMQANVIPEGYDPNQPFKKITNPETGGHYYSNALHLQVVSIPFYQLNGPERVEEMQGQINAINAAARFFAQKATEMQ